MRLNRFIATNTVHSRRMADDLIAKGRVAVNRKQAHPGMNVTDEDFVVIDGLRIEQSHEKPVTLLVNKPVGYVCSKDGQGSPTVYDLLPKEHQRLNIAGRLDKDSSGLVILTNDGKLLNELTHPSYNKEKVYEVELDKKLTANDLVKLKKGVNIGDDRLSILTVKARQTKDKKHTYTVTMTEGRNRQIRRTFEALKVAVKKLRRTKLGSHKLSSIKDGPYQSAE